MVVRGGSVVGCKVSVVGGVVGVRWVVVVVSGG